MQQLEFEGSVLVYIVMQRHKRPDCTRFESPVHKERNSLLLIANEPADGLGGGNYRNAVDIFVCLTHACAIFSFIPFDSVVPLLEKGDILLLQ